MTQTGDKPRVLAVVGPTASGKTWLGVQLAKLYGGEVISADSMQIYKGMDIASAKPSEEEKEGIPHHLMDFLNMDVPFSAADYVKLAKEKIEEVLSRGKLPVIVGGTGLYVDSLLENVKFSEGNASVEKLECMLRNAEDLGLSCPTVLHEAAEMLAAPGKSTVLPLLEMSRSGSELTEEGNTVLLTGGAVCTPEGVAAELSPEDMSGLCLLMNDGAKCDMTVICRGKNVRVMLYGTKTRITPHFADNRLRFGVNVSADCKIVTSQLPDPFSERAAVERLVGSEVCRRVRSLLAKSVTAAGADPAGLCYKIRAHSPQVWANISEDLSGYLENAVFDVTSDIKMERYGVMHG